MTEEDYEGIPREKIPWDPKINYNKCVSCGKCVDFCHTSAFKFECNGENKKTVVNFNRCIVFCRGCEDICPVKAITHPPEKQTRELIDKLKNKSGRKRR